MLARSMPETIPSIASGIGTSSSDAAEPGVERQGAGHEARDGVFPRLREDSGLQQEAHATCACGPSPLSVRRSPRNVGPDQRDRTRLRTEAGRN